MVDKIESVESPSDRLQGRQPILKDDLGVKVVYQPTEGTYEAKTKDHALVDIVAIHGKGAHPANTWSALREEGLDRKQPENWINWLNDPEMLPKELSNARVLRCGFSSEWSGVDAISTRPHTIAESVLDELKEHRVSEPERPLIFVAHSFGGLVLLKILLLGAKQKARWPGIYRFIVGLVFFGTPFRGSHGRIHEDILQRMEDVIRDGEGYVVHENHRASNPNNDWLRDVLIDFFLLIQQEPVPSIKCFFETKDTDYGKILEAKGCEEYKAGEFMVRIVDEHSACLDPTIPSITSKERTCDHFDLNKYLPGTKEWKDLVKCLKGMANKVPLCVDDTTRDRLLRNVCSDKALSGHLTRHRELHRDRLPDSIAWILQDQAFSDWQKGDVPLLWCPGRLGAGKSFVASKIVDCSESYIKEQKDTAVAFLYFEHDQVSSQNLHATISIIIRQLITHKSSLVAKYQDKLEKTCSNLDDRTELFTSVLEDLKASFVILDALDEFSGDHNKRVKFVEHFIALIKATTRGRLRVCITSRQFNDIERIVGTAPNRTLTISAPAEDIEKMIDDTIKGNPHFQQILTEERPVPGEIDLKSRLRMRIVERSDCVFKLARLQLDSTILQPNAAVVRDYLNTLSDDFDVYYQETLDRIKRRPEPELAVVLRLLAWVTSVQSPMSIAQLEFAVGMDQSPITSGNLDRVAVVNLEHYVALTEGLINMRDPLARSRRKYDIIMVDLEDLTLYCAHESVKAFLTKRKDQLRDPNSDIVIRSCMLCLSCDALISYSLQDSMSTAFPGTFTAIPGTFTGFPWTSVARHPKAALNFAKWAYANWPYYLLSPEIRERRDWDPVEEQALGKGVSETSGIAPNELQFLQYLIQRFRKNTVPPLHICALNEWPSLASWFLRNGVDANYRNAATLGWVALHFALYMQSLDTATVLVQHPLVNPNLYIGNQSMRAYWFGTPENPTPTKQLLDFEKALFSRPDLDLTSKMRILPFQSEERITYPILEVALYHPRLMKLLLLRSDIDVTVEDENGNTALHICSLALNHDAVAALVARSPASMDHPNNDGHTALMNALAPLDKEINESRAVSLLQLKRDCVKLLIQHGADCLLPNHRGQTALDFAVGLQDNTRQMHQHLQDHQNQLRYHIQKLAGNRYMDEEHLHRKTKNYTERILTVGIAANLASEIVAVLHHAGAEEGQPGTVTKEWRVQIASYEDIIDMCAPDI